MFTKKLHDTFVYNRRMDLLSDTISKQLKDGEKVLDVGCGDGKIDYLIMQKKDVDIFGVDVLVRDTTHIPVCKYDGKSLPYKDNEFDAVIFIDVLHHIENQTDILQEAKRVAKEKIIIKDHFREGLLAYSTLKFMDWIGNAHYGVNLPYNYLSKDEWDKCFSKLGLTPKEYITQLFLYPFPFSLIFDRNLHFVANIAIASESEQALGHDNRQ